MQSHTGSEQAVGRRRTGMLAGWQQQTGVGLQQLSRKLAAQVQENRTAILVTCAVLGWTLALWERFRLAKVKRQLTAAQQDATKRQGPMEPEQLAPTEHARAHSDFQEELHALKQEAQRLFTEPPSQVDLLAEEQQLLDLQEELEALQAELQQSLPRPGCSHARRQGSVPEWYTAVCSPASPSMAEQQPDLRPQQLGSLSSGSDSVSRNMSMPGFQRRLQSLAVNCEGAAIVESAPSRQAPGSPDVFRQLCDGTAGEATTWLTGSEGDCLDDDASSGSPEVRSSSASSYRMQLLGLPPFSPGGTRRTASTGGSAARKQALCSASLPSSPSEQSRLQGTTSQGEQAQAAGLAAGDRPLTPSVVPLHHSTHREVLTYRHTPHSLSGGKATPAAPGRLAGTASSKIPKLPQSLPGTPRAGTPGAAAAADFKIGTFKSDMGNARLARASTTGCSPAGDDGFAFPCKAALKPPCQQGLCTPTAALLSKIPKPASSC